MSARMQFPLSQRRHTNIAVVRYSKNGVKLEIACYKNKVISYRSGTETRLDEVLQVERIFTNVARGQLASEKEVEAVFGNDMSEQQAIKFMLDHGELQVAQQERTAEVDEMFKDIATIIAQKCVNTNTQHPFPSQVIEQALRSIGATVRLDQPVKKQALGLIRLLIDAAIIPIARANMKIRCTTTSASALDKLRAWCGENDADIVERDPGALGAVGSADGGDNNGAYSLLLVMQPSLFRNLDSFVKDELPLGSTIHMVDAAVTDVGTSDVVLDVNAVSRANAHHGEGEVSGAANAAAASALSGTGGSAYAGGRGHAWKTATSSGGKNTDQASSVSNNADSAAVGAGHGRHIKKGKAGRKGRGGDDSSDDADHLLSDDGHRDHVASAAPVNDLTAELQKLHVEDNSDDDEDGGGARGGRGVKGKKNKKNVSGRAGGAVAKKATPAPSPEDEGDTGDGRGRKGKGKKNKKVAAVPEKLEPEVEEAFSGSDEELMVNRKQRAKKQQQEAQHGVNNWDDEEDFDYGEDEEEAQA